MILNSVFVKNVGGFFEAPEAPIKNIKKSALHFLLTTYERNLFYNDGREIINAVLNFTSKTRFKKCYVPSYLCGSILQAYSQNNLSLNFYEVDDDFSYRFECEPSDSIVLLIDYFGTEKYSNKQIMELLDNNIVILDVTQSLFSKNRFKIIHPNLFLFASLRKTFPIPDGSILFYSAKDFVDKQIQPDGHYYMLELMLRKYFNLKYEENYNEKLYSEYKIYEERKDASIIQSKEMPIISKYILSYLDFGEIFRMRRCNLNYLFENIDEEISIINKREIKSPFFFPIKLSSLRVRNSLQRELANNGIFCPIHWVLPESVPHKFDRSYELSNTILSLPIDQRNTPSDLDRMVDLINSFVVKI